MPAVDLDDVEAGLARSYRGIDVKLLERADFRGCDRGCGIDERARHRLGGVLSRSARNQTALAVRRMRTPVAELDAGQRAVLVDGVAHQREVLDVLVVPDGPEHERQHVVLGCNRHVFGVNRSPAALGLHCPQTGLHARVVGARSDAMRYLVEAVSHGLRTKLDRLEQDVVLAVSCHAFPSSPGDRDPTTRLDQKSSCLLNEHR